MEFKNLRRNILYLLGKEWLRSGTLGPFNTRRIFEKLSDIPNKNMYDALSSIKERGLVELTPNYRNISLTQKGLSRIKVFQLPDNGKLPFPKRLD